MADQIFTTLYPQAGDPELLLLAKQTALLASRTAPEDVLIFDGLTAGARAYWTLPATPSLASSALTVHALVGVDGVSAAVVRGIWTLSSLSTAYAATALSLYRSGNDLVLGFSGAIAGTDSRRITIANWFTSSAAGIVPVTVTWTRLAAPTIYVRGVAVTGTETTIGTPPAWTDAIVATYFVAGVRAATEIWNERLIARPYNLALSAAEVLSLANGLAPATLCNGYGTVRHASDWSSWPNGWGFFGSSVGATLTANIDGVGTPVRDDTLRLAVGTGAAITMGTFVVATTIGRRYRLTGSYYIPAAQTITGITIVSGPMTIANGITGVGTWQTFTYDFVATDAKVTVLAAAGTSVTFTGNGTDVIYLNAWTVTEFGPVFRPVVQPCRIVDDAGPNQIGGVITAGVLPVTDRQEFRISGSVATNAVTLVQVFGAAVFVDPTLIALDTIDIKPNGTPTLSIGDGTTATKYTASAAKTAAWLRETLSANYPADSAKTGVHVNVTATGGTTCAVVIRGHRVG